MKLVMRMPDKEAEKKTYRTAKEKQRIINRLNRIEGQVKGVKKMVQEDAYCNDLLVQLVAIQNSVKSLSNTILENHLMGCVADDLEAGKLEPLDEIISLFKRFDK